MQHRDLQGPRRYSPRNTRGARISHIPGIKIRDKTLEKLEKCPDFVEGVVTHLIEVVDNLKSSLSTYSIGFHLMPIGSDEATCKRVEEMT